MIFLVNMVYPRNISVSHPQQQISQCKNENFQDFLPPEGNGRCNFNLRPTASYVKND